MPRTPKLIAVDWVDSKGVTNQWEFKEDLDPLVPSRCTSIGFLLEETADYTTLVQTLSDTQVLGRITIPRRAILRRQTLRRPN